MNNTHHKIDKPTFSKRKCLMDSEAVAKDKCYKLGVWLHSEHRAKLKKATENNDDDLSGRPAFH